jgi:hypothetical protein
MRRVAPILVAIAVVGLVAPAALAVSYASGVSTSGTDVSFVLNQPGDVTVVFDGGAHTMPLGALGAGAQMFSMAGYSSFEIQVSSANAPGWNQISTDGFDNSYYSPKGVVVNQNPSSPLFGNVYVSNALAGTTAAYGRMSSDGIYQVNADMSAVGFYDGGLDWSHGGGDSAGAGPWKSYIGPDDKLYVTDFYSDEVYEYSSDMSTATMIVNNANTNGGYIASVFVEGSQAGGDRAVYTVDSAFPTQGVFRHNLGSDATATGVGDTFISPDAYPIYPYDIAKDADGDWYTAQYRWGDNQEPALRKFDGAGTVPIGDDPAEVMWEGPDMEGGVDAMDLSDLLGLIAIGYRNGQLTGSEPNYQGMIRLVDPDTGALVFEFDSGMVNVRDLAFDAAGNLYAVDSGSELIRVYSPGGDWVATTGSDGSFSAVPEPGALALLVVAGLLIRRR